MDISLFLSNQKNSNDNAEESSNPLNNSINLNDLDLFYELLNSKPKEYICHLCQKHLNNQKNLNKHIKIHLSIRQYKCDKCDKVYKRSDHLSRHQIVHTTNPTPFECPHCIKQFSMKYHLKSHIANVHNENPFKFQCNQCSMFFPKKIKLLKHQRKEHKEIIIKVKCYYPYCYKSYLTQSKLDEHIKLSHGQISLEDIDKDHQEQCASKVKYYRCPYEDCIKIYTTYFNLITHIKSFHLSLNPFICAQCRKEFKHKSSLKRHVEKSNHCLLANTNASTKEEEGREDKDCYNSFEKLINEYIDDNNDDIEDDFMVDAFE